MARAPRTIDTLLVAALMAVLAYIGLRLVRAVSEATAEAITGAATATARAIQTPATPPPPTQHESPAEALHEAPWFLQPPHAYDPTDSLIPDTSTRPEFRIVQPGERGPAPAAAAAPDLAGEHLDLDVPEWVNGHRGPA
jgi:hypothetical protein